MLLLLVSECFHREKEMSGFPPQRPMGMPPMGPGMMPNYGYGPPMGETGFSINNITLLTA